MDAPGLGPHFGDLGRLRGDFGPLRAMEVGGKGVQLSEGGLKQQLGIPGVVFVQGRPHSSKTAAKLRFRKP